MRTVTTYDRVHRHILAWLKLKIVRLALFGPPGVGKSHAYKSALGNRRYHLFGGHQSPLHVYNTLYDAPNLPVVLDDISCLLRDPVFVDLLKGLLETGDREIRWGTTTSKLANRRTSFVCTSPVLIVLNRLPKNDPDVAAVLDRCDVISFEPTKAEIIARMREVFPEDGDLIDLIAELPALPSLRTLVHARDWRNSEDLNVIEELLSECGVSPEISQLVEIMEASPESEWCERYMQRTGLTDRTYRRHKRFADQIVECRKAARRCPNVLVGVPQPVPPSIAPAPSGSPQTDRHALPNAPDPPVA